VIEDPSRRIEAARSAQAEARPAEVPPEIENHQDRARQQGKSWYDMSWMWGELGIGREEA
jgi:hypothetical protein